MKSILRTTRARAIFSWALAAVLLAGAGYDPKRDPAADLKAAVQQAKGSGRRILLEVGGEWCGWCHVLEKLIDGDKEVAERLHAGFVVVKVNWSPENENTRFLGAYPPIYGYPHFFVLESDGTYLRSQPVDAFSKGNGYDRDKLLAFLKQWSPQPKKTAR